MPDLLSTFIVISVFVLCLSLLLFQFITGVPPMSSSRAEAAGVVALLREAQLPERPVIYELGSGWGSLVCALARAFPQAQIRGVELSPLPYWVARWRTRKLNNVRLQRANFYKVDLHDANAVTCYLMIKPMPALAAHLDQSLKPGTPVVALTFWFRQRQVALSQQNAAVRGGVALYFWPARMAAAT